jgi:anti-sigma regulatory factor (Ser/Thr protein kinase)
MVMSSSYPRAGRTTRSAKPDSPLIDCVWSVPGNLRVLLRNDQALIRNAPTAPAAARRYVRETLDGLPPDVVDAVTLMVSELATNCVRHANTDFTLSIEQTGRQVRVDIADTGMGRVTKRDPEPADVSGRGLSIVEQLSDTWGVRECVDGEGKSVWFMLNLRGCVNSSA